MLVKGAKGEDEILFQLKYSGMDMEVIRDLYLVYDDLSAQIDYYIVTPWLHFVVECKNLYGNITVNNKGDFIRSYEYNGKTVKEGIPSPITQNERHLLVLKNLRLQNAGKIAGLAINSTFHNYTKSIVVLANSKTVLNDRHAPADVKRKVIRADALVNTIKQYIRESKEIKSSKKEMLGQANYILSLHQENQTDYVAKYRAMVEEQEKEAAVGKAAATCPRCGAQLVVRNGKNGKFIGCSAFPKCRYTTNIQEGEYNYG